MSGIKEAVKRIFSTEDVLQKHIILFLLTGIPAMLSMPLNELSKKPNLSLSEWGVTSLLFLLCLAAGLFIFGYVLKFVHNSFDREKFDIMPEISLDCFKVIYKALPIIFSWFGYLIIYSLVFGFCFVLSVMFKTFLPITLMIVLLAFIIIILPMVFVDFAVNYEYKGLLGIHKPFTYLRKCGKGMLITLLKLLPVFLLMQIINYFCLNANDVFAFLLIGIGGYIGILYQLTLYYCYGKVLKD